MFSRVRIAIRFFFLGLAVGVLLAPRSGQETRRLVRERADRLLNDLLDAATLGTYDNGSGGQTAPSPSADRVHPALRAPPPRATPHPGRGGPPAPPPRDGEPEAARPARNGRRTRSASTASAS